MRYSQLCPVHFGTGAIRDVPEIAKELGIKTALIVTDMTVQSTGHPDRVMGFLTEAGIRAVVFSDVEMDAPDYCVNAGAELASAVGADGVIAIGGGSCLDAAKAISFVAANFSKIKIQDVFDTPPRSMELNPPLKNIMIPTTSGTGSEVTIVAVVSDTEKRRKCGCLIPPNVAIVDPELTVGLAPLITAYTAMDAFSHCTEALASKGNNPHSDLLALNAIKRILNWVPVAVSDSNNLEAREQLAIASNFAGKAFNDSMVHIGHALAHGLGSQHHVPHGIACALVTPIVLEYTAISRPNIFRELAALLGIEEFVSDENLGKALGDAVRAFIKEIGIPSLQQLGISREDTIACANYARTEDMRFAGLIEIPDEELEQMLAKAYDNYK